MDFCEEEKYKLPGCLVFGIYILQYTALLSLSLLTYNCEVELHVPGGRVPVIHPAPVDPLVHQADGLDDQGRPSLGSSAGQSEVCSAAEPKCRFC